MCIKEETVLKSLPTVTRFCYWLSLKWGVIIISVVGAMTMGFGNCSHHFTLVLPYCVKDSMMDHIVFMLSFISFINHVIVLVGSVQMIYGVIENFPIAAIRFLYIILYSIPVYICSFIFSVCVDYFCDDCSYTWELLPQVLHIFGLYYAAVIIKSYYIDAYNNQKVLPQCSIP